MTNTEIYCTTCNDTQEITCPVCHGNTCQWCECELPECNACDNIGSTCCPDCYPWT